LSYRSNQDELEKAMQTNVPNTAVTTTPTSAIASLRTVAFSLLVDRALSA
jgi:hypothetical protein